ncbi:hypothetical protein IFM89_002973, partial [Coptis chinensis]
HRNGSFFLIDKEVENKLQSGTFFLGISCHAWSNCRSYNVTHRIMRKGDALWDSFQTSMV